ncbi:hypothetical protein N9L26_02040 [Candidatus Pacebacteria bacterium]|nr:hypothetical protein [Candidatus Paceibacterota bacterium]
MWNQVVCWQPEAPAFILVDPEGHFALDASVSVSCTFDLEHGFGVDDAALSTEDIIRIIWGEREIVSLSQSDGITFLKQSKSGLLHVSSSSHLAGFFYDDTNSKNIQ